MQPQSGGAGFQPPSHKSPLIIVILSVLFVAAAGFGLWAFSGRQELKNNADQKIAVAVTAAKAAETTKLNQQFAEQLKKPYNTFSGSATYGSISFSYPKTYSAYVDESNTSQPLNAYFHPTQVPGTSSNTAFALRVELLTTSYSQTLDQYSSDIKAGKIKAAAYVPPKMAGVKNVQSGTKLTGPIGQNQQGDEQKGILVIIAVRDKTLKIYTQSTDFASDFNNIILPSLTFEP